MSSIITRFPPSPTGPVHVGNMHTAVFCWALSRALKGDFIIRLEDGYTIFHAGDTGIFSSMALWGKLYKIDLALLPIGGVFTMDAAQAALARVAHNKDVVPAVQPKIDNTEAFVRKIVRNVEPRPWPWMTRRMDEAFRDLGSERRE